MENMKKERKERKSMRPPVKKQVALTIFYNFSFFFLVKRENKKKNERKY